MIATSTEIETAVTHLQQGDVIAYPTEAVYGLGCDPFNQTAVNKILQLKQRSVDKGLILIASSWEQIKELVLPIDPDKLKAILSTWPGPNTWIFPASKKAPKWITGQHKSIALRITAHPTAQAICTAFNGPIVSTSANKSNQAAIKELDLLKKAFGNEVDYIVPGQLGDLDQPTQIKDAVSSKIIR